MASSYAISIDDTYFSTAANPPLNILTSLHPAWTRSKVSPVFQRRAPLFTPDNKPFVFLRSFQKSLKALINRFFVYDVHTMTKFGSAALGRGSGSYIMYAMMQYSLARRLGLSELS